MIRDWLSGHRGDRVFLTGREGTLTYGEVLARLDSDPGQVVVRPTGSLESVIELMGAGTPGRQIVVVNPDLPDGEQERRIDAALSARGRDAAVVLFTSGTTGPAKAVRLTAANWMAAARSSAVHLDHGPDDVWLAAMPLHHVGGLSILYRSAYVGASVRWLPAFEVGEVVSELRRGVTIASVVPTMLARILAFDDGSYSGLRAVLVGGGPIPAGLLEQATERGLPVLPTYGMTETCAQVATLRPGSPLRYAVEPLDGIDVRIDGEGRIQLRGDQISPGYADEDDRAPEDWFTTPDLGEIGGDGLLRVLGRSDHVIVTGGENVNPETVETTLVAFPGVVAAVVVGVPDPVWGQKVVGVYEGRAGAGEILDWARQRLAPAEVPKLLKRVESIPMRGAKPDRDGVLAIVDR